MACNSLGYPWGPREDEALARMWNDGLPTNVIAHEMGRTVFSIRNRARKLELPPRKTYGAPMIELRAYMPAQMHETLKKRARERHWTVSAYIRHCITECNEETNPGG
jgi:hypothetical protein